MRIFNIYLTNEKVHISWSKFNITNSNQIDSNDIDFILDNLIKVTDGINCTSNPYTNTKIFYLDEYIINLADSDVFKDIKIVECPRNGECGRSISKEEFKKLVLSVYDG